MAQKLGIYVTSDQHLEQLIKLVQAANRKGVKVDIFFSHLGCNMANDERFPQLAGLARMAVCKVCYVEHRGEKPVKGLGEKDYATQERHCEIVDTCDRYLNF